MHLNLDYVAQKLLLSDDDKPLNLANESSENIIKHYEDFPRFINLETTNNCTARCVMCGIDEWRKNIKSPYMDDTLFYKIADEILAHKKLVQKVALFVGNEPLLDKNLPSRVKYITNGGGGLPL